MSRAEIEASLVKQFPARNVRSALGHFSNMVDDYRSGDWEDATAKAGKFIEAVSKALVDHCKVVVPTDRKYKAGTALTAVRNTPAGAFDDSVKLQIPRACEFIYDVASNRGARHDPNEVDPNMMDATVSVSCCTWILAEMVRFSEKGAVNLDQAKRLIDGLTARTYPMLEDVDGRVYFHCKDKSARGVAVVLLANKHPERIARADLQASVERHGFSTSAARMGVSRLRGLVDDDGDGNLKLLQPGLLEAEEILKNAE